MTTEALQHNFVVSELFEAFSFGNDGRYIFVYYLDRNQIQCSKQAVDFFGLPSEIMEADDKVWLAKIHPEDREAYMNRLENAANGSYSFKYRVKDRFGSYTTCLEEAKLVKDQYGKPLYYAGIMTNYGVQSRIDNVTCLPNLFAFFNDLKDARLAGRSGAVLLIGPSKFSEINDMYGYSYGNKILIRFAEIIQETFGREMEIYRMEGVKFSVRTEMEDGYAELTKRYAMLQEVLRQGIQVDDNRIHLFISGGIMALNDHTIGSHTVYSCLLYALSESKNHHQGELVPFQNRISDNNKKWLEELNVIRESVIDGCRGFFLCYQPIVRVKDRQLSGMEALIRWKNDVYGTVVPEEFIPILEKDAVFPELGSWIIRQAIRDAKPFVEKDSNFIVNVNLSYAQIEKSNFSATVMNILHEEQFPSTNLCLELTERCRIMDEKMLIDKVCELKVQGIRFALDDFGTGFSSLNLMRKLPIDEIKVDRQFIKDIENNRIDQNIINGLTHMVINSGKYICIEGVENEEMQRFLERYPVSYFQGYLYSKPVPIDEFKQLKFDSSSQGRLSEMSDNEKMQLDERTNDIIIQCAKILHSDMPFKDAVGQVMAVMSQMIHPDRIYMSVINTDQQTVSMFQEWCAPGVTGHISYFQNRPFSEIQWWMRYADEDFCMVVPDVDKIRDTLPDGFYLKNDRHIRNVIEIFFKEKNQLIGYIGADNYYDDEYINTKNLLQSISFFLTSELKNQKLIAELRMLSRYDQMAGCDNRNAFEEDAIAAERTHTGYGIVFADLNGLKLTNDTLGHSKGDELIIHARETLEEDFPDGHLYRIGGDEFLLMYRELTAYQFADYVEEGIAKLNKSDVNISVGWSYTSDSGERIRTQLNAERMMYRNKAEYYKKHDRRKE